MPRAEPACAAGANLTERLRHLVRSEARACPTCGHMDRSLREMASQLGVAHATLWRFLADKPTSERVINRLYERYCGAIALVNVTDELPHERNARLRREAVEGEGVQP